MVCLSSPGRAVKVFEAQLAVLELLEHKALFTAGYKAVMHCHTVRGESCTQSALCVLRLIAADVCIGEWNPQRKHSRRIFQIAFFCNERLSPFIFD